MKTLNLTGELERLIADISSRVDEFRHVDPSRVMVCVATTRGGGVHGTYAKIHPLRFENGSRTTLVKRRRSTVRCEVTPVSRQGVEMLYVIYVLVPRFLNLPLREKLITLFHELYHVSPAFDGDIRRFPGKNYAHGSSRKKYNALMALMVDRYLDEPENVSGAGFLEGDMAMMRARYGSLVGRRLTAPKLRIVPDNPA
jgi:predicted metallopeptidase